MDTFAKATAVWDEMNCGSSKSNNAFGCLAGHLLATELNRANGTDACIDATISAANALLASKAYAGPGTYSLTSAERTAALDLKSKLDTYNNGGGCP